MLKVLFTLIVKSWKTHPENFPKFQFSGLHNILGASNIPDMRYVYSCILCIKLIFVPISFRQDFCPRCCRRFLSPHIALLTYDTHTPSTHCNSTNIKQTIENLQLKVLPWLESEDSVAVGRDPSGSGPEPASPS